MGSTPVKKKKKKEGGSRIEQREKSGYPSDAFLTLRMTRSQNALQSCPKMKGESQDIVPCLKHSLDVGHPG